MTIKQQVADLIKQYRTDYNITQTAMSGRRYILEHKDQYRGIKK